MKIPEDKYFSPNAEKAWEFAAAQIGIEQGIIVEVGKDFMKIIRTLSIHGGGTTPCHDVKITRIYFKLNGHEFETLTDLKRALQLKAFL